MAMALEDYATPLRVGDKAIYGTEFLRHIRVESKGRQNL